nr:MAG TPA: tail collar fiber protein [Caudoviricetes sp.]
MAAKDLAKADAVNSILASNYVMVEIGGSIKRISVKDFMNAIQAGSLNLSQYAWGIPIYQSPSSKTSPEWGRVGNLDMWAQYKDTTGRYLLTQDGRLAKLSKTNSNYFADGTTVDETKGNIMFHAPRLYYLVKTDAVAGIPYLWLSLLPIGGHFIESPCFGAYKADVISDKLVSRSGRVPKGNLTISQFWAKARANGNDYGLSCYDHRRLMMMLQLSEYGSPNCQDKIGYGVGGSVNGDFWGAASKLTTGATKTLGDSCGSIPIDALPDATAGKQASVNSSRVSLFGIEDGWNWQHEMVQNIYFGRSENTGQTGKEVFIYEGNRMPTDAELTTKPAGDYRKLERINEESYVSKMVLGEYFDLIAQSTTGGGSNNYWCDTFWRNFATGQLCLFGGRASSGSGSGLACVTSDTAFSSVSASSGTRLAYYGKTQYVNGADL